MNPDDKKFIACIGIFAVILIGGYVSLISYTGFSTPFSVVMSQSMQHDDDQSQIGCIDTGDIVIIREVDKCQIQSYVEGTVTGFSSFGDYGSVIIYKRNSWSNPVIHRAILWLDYDPNTGTWSAPSLSEYTGEWYWKFGYTSNETTGMRGTLYLKNITQSGKNVEINLESSALKAGGSGYLTMGDNPNNNYLDQYSGAIVNHLIDIEDIQSIPVFEIPWAGTMKILFKNNGDNLDHVPNSLPSLIMAIALIISFVIVTDAFLTRRDGTANSENDSSTEDAQKDPEESEDSEDGV